MERGVLMDPGWGILRIASNPSWSYTFGLKAKFGVPDVLVFSLSHVIAMALLNTLGALAKDGKPIHKAGEITLDLAEGLPAAFVAIAEDKSVNYMGRGLVIDDILGVKSEAVQLVWSDETGKFPWDPEFSEKFRLLQPVLGDPPK